MHLFATQGQHKGPTMKNPSQIYYAMRNKEHSPAQSGNPIQ